MQAIRSRFTFLFRSTKGLVLVAIAAIALVTAIFGMLSGPMVEWGVKDVVVRLLDLDLVPAEREGRIIMLYHAIAMAVVAIAVYLITAVVPMKPHEQATINATVTAGYILSMICGLAFAYLGHEWIFHGLWLFGLSLVFFAGILLAAALWPWRRDYQIKDTAYAHWGRIDLERAAFFTMAVATLGSAMFGAVTGSYWGNGHETFLAEDLIREPHKTNLEYSIIGHLHIMLTLIAVAVALLVGRRFDFKGLLHKISMPIMIVGTIVITIGAWTVVPIPPIAHMIIYFGSVPVLLAALFMVIFGFRKLIQEGRARSGGRGFGASLKALVHDPLRFGMLWQMVFMNFTVSFIGIFVAVKLDEIFRVWPARDERLILTGHWHVLSGIVATIILLYYADMVGLKGKVRQWFGWLVIVGSDVAFASVTIFEVKRLFVSEADQQPVVNWTMALADIGLIVVLAMLAGLMVWRLVDLFKRDGQWRTELRHDPHVGIAQGDAPESLAAAQELSK